MVFGEDINHRITFNKPLKKNLFHNHIKNIKSRKMHG